MHRPARSLFAAALFALAAPMLCQAQALSGTVRNAQGVPVPNATVTLTCNGAMHAPLQVTTADNGTYAVAKLAPCSYRITVQQGAASAALTLEIGAVPAEQTQNITFAPEAGTPRPRFEASGIRGLIDPGGYSAPANAAAASSLLSGMAEANQTAGGCATTRPRALLEAAHRNDPANVSAAMDYAEALLADRQFASAHDVLSSLPESSGEERLLRLQARADEGSGQFPAAAEAYARIYARHPAPEDLFAEGYEQVLAGKTTVAAALYREGLRTFPRAPALLIGLGTTEFLAGHAPEAIGFFLTAAEAEPADPRPYPFLAAASGVSSAENARVYAALHHHLALVPRDAAAHLALATVFLHDTGVKAASRSEAELRASLGIDPRLAEAHFQLGALLAWRGADEEAVRELQLAVALDPDRREGHYRLAQELRKTGRTAVAAQEMQSFQKARTEEAVNGSDVRRYLSVMGRRAACPNQ